MNNLTNLLENIQDNNIQDNNGDLNYLFESRVEMELSEELLLSEAGGLNLNYKTDKLLEQWSVFMNDAMTKVFKTRDMQIKALNKLTATRNVYNADKVVSLYPDVLATDMNKLFDIKKMIKIIESDFNPDLNYRNNEKVFIKKWLNDLGSGIMQWNYLWVILLSASGIGSIISIFSSIKSILARLPKTKIKSKDVTEKELKKYIEDMKKEINGIKNLYDTFKKAGSEINKIEDKKTRAYAYWVFKSAIFRADSIIEMKYQHIVTIYKQKMKKK